MAESVSPRLGLPRWSANTDGPSRIEIDGAMASLEANAAMYAQGTRAARPAPGKAGRLYKVVGDTALLNGMQFYDDGTAWTVVGANAEDVVARASGAATVPLIAKGFAGQTAKLQEWRSSADVVLASIDPTGKGTLQTLAVVGLGTIGGLLQVTGALTANGGISTTTVQTSGDVTAARVKSTANRLDGNPKIELKADGTGRNDGLLGPGFMCEYAGGGIPAGWLYCDGTAVSRTTYADLFAAIGTVHGAGDGSTTFNLPDSRERVTIGTGSAMALGTKDAIAAGAARQTAQGHAHAHTDSFANGSVGSHNHSIAGQSQGTVRDMGQGGYQGPSEVSWTGHNHGGNTGLDGAHTHTISGGVNSGGSVAHPFLVVTKLIRT